MGLYDWFKAQNEAVEAIIKEVHNGEVALPVGIPMKDGPNLPAKFDTLVNNLFNNRNMFEVEFKDCTLRSAGESNQDLRTNVFKFCGGGGYDYRIYLILPSDENFEILRYRRSYDFTNRPVEWAWINGQGKWQQAVIDYVVDFNKRVDKKKALILRNKQMAANSLFK